MGEGVAVRVAGSGRRGVPPSVERLRGRRSLRRRQEGAWGKRKWTSLGKEGKGRQLWEERESGERQRGWAQAERIGCDGEGLGIEGEKWLRNPKCLAYISSWHKKRFGLFLGRNWANISRGRHYSVAASKNGFMEAVVLR